MPSSPQIPLKAVSASVDAQFCDFKTVQQWLDFFVANIVADGQAIATLFTNDVVYSPTEPQGAQRGKLWVKESGGKPRGVGLLIDGEYVIIPIPADEEADTDVPNGIVVPWAGSGSAPEGWSIVSTTQATAWGLPVLTGLQYIQQSA